MQTSEVSEFEDGEVKMWIEQETIHLRAGDKSYDDPVELTSATARQIAQKLIDLADAIDQE